MAIVALGPSCESYIDTMKRLGGRGSFADEIWTINSLGDILLCDRVFHMDDVRIQEVRAAARPRSNIAVMLEWMRKRPAEKPPIIYTSRAHPNYPAMVDFPLEDVMNATSRMGYFNNTGAYAVAFAVYLQVKELSLWGLDYTYPNSQEAERGRACTEYWLGYGRGKLGWTKFSFPSVTSILDANCPDAQRYYGYDTLRMALDPQPDRLKISFEPIPPEEWPTAEQIEAAYDHGAMCPCNSRRKFDQCHGRVSRSDVDKAVAAALEAAKDAPPAEPGKETFA